MQTMVLENTQTKCHTMSQIFKAKLLWGILKRDSC